VIRLERLLGGAVVGITVECECGAQVAVQNATVDLSGGFLCPPCAADSAVLCDLCGKDKPVALYTEDGSDARLYLGVPAYIAICADCDHPETTLRVLAAHRVICLGADGVLEHCLCSCGRWPLAGDVDSLDEYDAHRTDELRVALTST
jgi:hypothetical protein